MTGIIKRTRIYWLIILGIILLLSPTVSFAGADEAAQEAGESRFHLSMIGVYSHSESIGCLSDLSLEIQFSFSPRIRAGLGIGYLRGNDNLHMNGNFGNIQGGMMGGMNGGMMGSFAWHDHSLKIVPVTLNLYYALPVNPKLDVFMQGSGGYYIGYYRDQTTQNESAFGPHFGMGLNFKVAKKIVIVVEGAYRFVSLKSFKSELHEGFRQGMVDGELEKGFWHFHHHDREWQFHEERGAEQQTLMDAYAFDIIITGLSLRAGIKFLL